MTITLLTINNCPRCAEAQDRLRRMRIPHLMVQTDSPVDAWEVAFPSFGVPSECGERRTLVDWRLTSAQSDFATMQDSMIQTFPVLVIDGVAHDFDDAMAILKEIQQ